MKDKKKAKKDEKKGKKPAKKQASKKEEKKGKKKPAKEEKSSKKDKKDKKESKGSSPFRSGSATDKAFQAALKGAKIKEIEAICKKEGKPSAGVLNRIRKGKGKGFSWKVKEDEKNIQVLNFKGKK